MLKISNRIDRQPFSPATVQSPPAPAGAPPGVGGPPLGVGGPPPGVTGAGGPPPFAQAGAPICTKPTTFPAPVDLRRVRKVPNKVPLYSWQVLYVR